MSNGFTPKCLCCGSGVNEFTDTTGYMKCPKAYKSRSIIMALMPVYKTEKEREHARKVLNAGGYDLHSSYNHKNSHSPIIPIIEELATRLMRHEPLNGVMHHDNNIICKKCAEKLAHCSSCGHDHKPVCPVCKAELVPF